MSDCVNQVNAGCVAPKEIVMVPLSALLMSLAVAAEPQPAYVMETKPSQKIEAELVVSERFPSFKAKEWVIYAGDAPRLPGQPIVHTVLEPGGRAVKEHSAHGQPVLLTRIPGI